jgi:hypothetical protein
MYVKIQTSSRSSSLRAPLVDLDERRLDHIRHLQWILQKLRCSGDAGEVGTSSEHLLQPKLCKFQIKNLKICK